MERELRKKICKPQIIRAFLLDKGDVFNVHNSRCIVALVTKTEIIFSILDEFRHYKSYKDAHSMGRNSRQKIELLFSECEYYVSINN